jgi:DNA-binding MarR family transcriptional regulator
MPTKRILRRSKRLDPPRHLSAELDESIGFLIADTGRAVKRALYLRIAQHGIRGGSWFCLRALWQNDGVTQRELSATLGIMEPSTVEMLRAMERDGLVRRERDHEDRRKVRVYLTDRAKKLQKPLLAIAEHVNLIMLGDMSHAEEARLKHMLVAIREILQRDIAAIAGSIETEDKALALANTVKSDVEISKAARGNGRSRKTDKMKTSAAAWKAAAPSSSGLKPRRT